MMDAKPQRPIRNVRIRADENVPPMANGPYKTIHQRNKSSPALSTIASVANGKTTGVRTAFGDATNISNVNKLGPAKDDMAYPVKVKAHIPEKISGIQAPQEKKSAAFLRPAQRPLSVAGLKSFLPSSSGVKEAEPIPKSTTSVETHVPTAVVANTRKFLTKKSTTIFRDTTSSQGAESELKPLKESSAIGTQPLPVQEEYAAPRQDALTEDLVNANSQPSSFASAVPENIIRQDVISELAQVEVLDPVPSTHLEVDVVEEPQTFHDSLLTQPIAESNLEDSAAVIEANQQVANISAPVPTGIPAPIVDSIASRYALAPAEPEEYWDDEDNVEDDGYVTAHSYHSRSENTTGGATTLLFPQVTKQIRKELAAAKQLVEESRTAEEIEDECFDTSMVAEYGDEIFAYMKELEIKMLPNAHYMDNQAEIQWSMRSVLIDWVVQVHLRFNLLPETLFLTVNYIDRFLSCKIVSLGKLQLVGATALFIAAKYEEINCPSVQEIVYMVDGGYTTDEVLKAERFMLSMLQFELGFPGPMSFLRRISKADDYDLETRTLAKYFLEVTIMDERFVGSPASFVAAGSHCLSRLMLRKGNWGPSHVYYSGYTYSQLLPLLILMVECCESPRKHHSSVHTKYCDKRFKRASTFVEAEMASGFRLPVSQKELSSPQVIDYIDQASWRRGY